MNVWRDYGGRGTKVYCPDGWDKMTFEERVKAFLKSEDTVKRFDWPFPMGVFGTLRENQGNNRLMHRATVEQHRLAFLPHFYARGLSISTSENSCAPFEVFYYTPEEWEKMIDPVDSLESFSPSYAHGTDKGGYYRTLAWLKLLPEGYTDKWFPSKERANLWGEIERDMRIPPKDWNNYESVPCWIYSNMASNRRLKDNPTSPIIYPS